MLKPDFLINRPLRWLLPLLIGAILLPLLFMAYVSLQQKQALLTDEVQRQLEHTNKQFSTLVFLRLREAENDLLVLRQQANNASEISATIVGSLGNTLSAAASTQHGTLTPLLGKWERINQLSQDQPDNTSFHKSLLLASPAGNAAGYPALLIARKLSMEADQDGIVAARINREYLWPQENGSDPVKSCVFNFENVIIHCSPDLTAEQTEAMSRHAREQKVNEPLSGSRQDAFLISSLRLGMDTQFQSKDWLIVSSRDIGAEIAAIRRQSVNLIPALLIASIIVTLTAAIVQSYGNRIVDSLIIGMRRVAASDFDYGLKLGYSRKLNTLVRAFNFMTERLRRQFRTHKTMTDLDRLILSGWDVHRVAKHVLSGLRDILNYRQAYLIVSDEKIVHKPLAFLLEHPNGSITEKIIPLEYKDISFFEAHAEGFFLNEQVDFSFIKEFRTWKSLTYFALPILSHHRLSGLLITAVDTKESMAAETCLQLRSFVNRVAVVLSTLARKQQLIAQVNTDSLTHIPNRRLLKAYAEKFIHEAQQGNHSGALLFIDLDRFKNVNDAYGHMIGDKLLTEASQRLKECIKEDQVVSRFGGDEFAILIPKIKDYAEIAQSAKQIIETLSHPYSTLNKISYIGASIGIAIFPHDAEDFETLLVNADTAMSQAKKSGRDRYVFYRNEMGAERRVLAVLENETRAALAKNELEVYYQPKVDVSSSNIAGFEALLRWHHPKYGYISPDKIVTVAEQSALINDLGNWVIRAVCRQIRDWQQQAGQQVSVAVNISAKQLVSENFLSQLVEAIEVHGIDKRQFEIEVTESLFVSDLEKASDVLNQISELGIRIAVDDFGTGFSSLSYLARLPIHTLKIDRSFISDLGITPKSKDMVRGIISLAHNLDIQVVAEGVETLEQLQQLKEMGCDQVQGFFFSRAVPAVNALGMLTGNIKSLPTQTTLLGEAGNASKFRLIK